MKELDINLTDNVIIDGDFYGISDASAKEVGLPGKYIKKHEIIRREIIQRVNTHHRTYYGYVDLSQMPQMGKFVVIVGMFGDESKVNIDTIEEIKDVQAVLIRWDVTCYDNIWKKIKGSKWAYNYVWYHFDLHDNVLIANDGDNIEHNLFKSDADNNSICGVLDYEGKKNNFAV